MQKWLVLLVIAALLVLTAGCTEDAPPEQPSTPAPTPSPAVKVTTAPRTPVPTMTTIPVTTLTVSESSVTILDNEFRPAELTIKVNSQVRWVNADDHPHRVKFANDGFSAFLLGAGQSSSQQFYRSGVYQYSDAIYPFMRGTITVVQ
jgi:plastocyanin